MSLVRWSAGIFSKDTMISPHVTRDDEFRDARLKEQHRHDDPLE